MHVTRIGAHLSVGKGLEATAEQAVALGLESVQIFIRNPRGRGARQYSEEELSSFQQILRDNDIGPVVVHIPYICNPAAAKDDLYEYAYQVVAEDLQRCSLVKAEFLVLHPGSYTTSSLEQGVERIAGLLNRVLDQYDGQTCLLLETMAGQGTEIGKNFEEIDQILQQINNKDKIGVCFDTCHTYAAGYDCTTRDGIEEIKTKMDNTFGCHMVKIVHANDSSKELGSRRDRHAHIGEGLIGESGFRNLMHDELFATLPFILETPFEGIAKDVARLKNLRQR
jgi:deoxyribonuclease-4